MKILAIVLLAVGAFWFRPTAQAHQFLKLDPPADVSIAQTTKTTAQEQKPLKPAEKAPETKPAETPPPAPVPCKDDQWLRADNGQCMDKPPVAPAVNAAQKPAPVASTGSGSCASEIAKYGWNQSVALAVAQAESGMRTWIVNNNPATRDYSVGCFQINIYGANARNRPSEAALKDAAVNVRFAYGIYVANGHSFIGQWGVCSRGVRCY